MKTIGLQVRKRYLGPFSESIQIRLPFALLLAFGTALGLLIDTKTLELVLPYALNKISKKPPMDRSNLVYYKSPLISTLFFFFFFLCCCV